MPGTPAASQKIKCSGYRPKRNDVVIAIDRLTGKDACAGPFVVTGVCDNGAVKGIDQQNNHREFRLGTWRINPAGRQGGH